MTTTHPAHTILTPHGLIAPDTTSPHIAHIAHNVWASLHDTHPHPNPFTTHAMELGWPTAERILLLVVDGLGWHNIHEHRAFAPTLTHLLNTSKPAMTGFPTTTATSMATIGTGELAGQTGLTGYSAIHPHTGDLSQFISWKNLPDPHHHQQRAQLTSLAQTYTTVTSISQSTFKDSGLTNACFSGAHHVSAETLTDTVNATVNALRAPGLVHTYWGQIDAIGHVAGPNSVPWTTALADFDVALADLLQRVPPDTLVVLTADHGMVHIGPRDRIDVADHYALMRSVRGVAGEPRAPQIYTNSPRSAADVAARWADTLGSHAVVLDRHQAQESGLLGQVDDRVAPWFGDVLVLTTGTTAIVDSSTMAAQAIALKGMHGSLTPTEVHVPLLAVRPADL